MTKYLMTLVAVFGVLALGACKPEETSGTADTKDAAPAATSETTDAAGSGSEAKKADGGAGSGTHPAAGRYVDAP